jgi:hypothetical protein
MWEGLRYYLAGFGASAILLGLQWGISGYFSKSPGREP